MLLCTPDKMACVKTNAPITWLLLSGKWNRMLAIKILLIASLCRKLRRKNGKGPLKKIKAYYMKSVITNKLEYIYRKIRDQI